MSEQDRFDWSDDTDFESLADEPIEGFADYEDAEEYHDFAGDFPADVPGVAESTGSSSDAVADVTGADAKPKAKGKPRRRESRGITGGSLGFLVAVSILVAAAGVGSVGLLAVGVSPAVLWQPEALLNWPNYLDPIGHPLNLLALVCLGVVCLTLLGSGGIARTTGREAGRTRAAEDMLDLLTSLRLDNEEAWQNPAFKADATAATFVAETLGAWRLQAARQRQYTGLEGEIRRLQKAVADGSRADLSGRFDTPAVGALSDEIVRYVDERESLNREIADLRAKDHAAADELMRLLQDARCWQDVSATNLGLQGTAVERLAERLDDWAAALVAGAENGTAEAACAAFKSELNGACTAENKGPDVTAELTALVDKGSKLAFQIAMEVARLGPRGERLGPMSQSLEDLTTDFRQVADQMRSQAGPGRSLAARLHGLVSRFADVETQVAAGGIGDALAQVRQLGPAAGQVARNLGQLVHSHRAQAERLEQLGAGLGEFAGTTFDAADTVAGGAENAPAGVISLEEVTLLSDTETGSAADSIHQPAEVDPFSVTPPRRVADAPGDPSFTGSVTEPDADIFGSGLDSSALPRLDIVSSFGERANPFAGFSPDAPDPQLPDDGEKVYDLDDFDAAAVTTDEEAVHDLTEFGAVPDAGNEAAVADEPVYDLSNFGAEPMEQDEEPVYDLSDFGSTSEDLPASAIEEEVFDLASLGAVRLDDAGTGPEETVYDLNAFGAVPLT